MPRMTILALAALLAPAILPVTQDPPPQPAQPPAEPVEAPVTETEDPPGAIDPIRTLLEEVDRLNAEMDGLREALAAAELQSAAAERELEELRAFIADHHQLGQDYQQYSAVKAAAEDEARRRQQEAAKERRDMERAERVERMRLARAGRDQQRAEAEREASYRERGFGPLGLDVFISRMAFSYHAVDDTVSRFKYIPGHGRFLRFYPGSRIDFSTMTFSGSILNASAEPRDLGVAITFFDESGHQVGHETIQIRNARPDVPYPFTSQIQMALDRPFDSSSQYVLYADAVGE